MTITLDGYKTRYNPADNYEKILFRSGRGLQSTELNDLQEQLYNQVKCVSDTILADGDVVKGGGLHINIETGLTKIGAASIYIRGSVREMAEREITIPTTDTFYIGVWLTEMVITEVEDPGLRDPVSSARNYQEPGAGRLKIDYEWGLKNDTHTGTFYPVYRVENGVQIITEPPPQLDAITTALARFDRESNGCSYVVNGMEVVSCPTVDDKQFISITEGIAHIEGFSVQFPYALRKSFPLDPDLQTIINEPITFHEDTPGSNSMKVLTACKPINNISRVSISISKTADVLRGSETLENGSYFDPLADTSVSDILSIKQGAKTYIKNTDYKKNGNRVEWLVSGSRPSTGSSFTVTYQYITQVQPTQITDIGFMVSGAVEGSDIFVDYQWKMPRIDVIILDQEGHVLRVKGMPHPYFPRAPKSPENQLSLAQIAQFWYTGEDLRIVNHAVHTISMSELKEMKQQISDLFDLVTTEQLRNNANASDPAAKKGVFVDPFLDDDMRDQGEAQTAAIVRGELVLPVSETILDFGGTTMQTLQTLDYIYETIINQPMVTGDMAVNPYQAFEPIPPKVTLNPQVDRWTETETLWNSPITQRFTQWFGWWEFWNWGRNGQQSSSVTTQETRKDRAAEFLRQRDVSFTIENLGPNEKLTQILFDGISVAIK